MQHIETVVFDLGGVLIDWNPEYLYRKIFTNDKEMKYFLSHICTPDWNEEQDAGRTIKEANKILTSQYPKYTTEIEAYYGRWGEMLGGPISASVEILKKLKEEKQVKLVALTNWSAETFPIAYKQNEYEFLHWFAGILVSGEEKIRKPFPEIFQLLCKRFQIVPENSLFIDDNLRNITAAHKLGFHVIHFTSPGQLKKELERYGILKTD